MIQTVVGVLRGGTSNEYQHSLKTGAAVLAALPTDRYDSRDILVDRGGLWHLHGMPTTPARALSGLDVVLNMLHGGAGEDGSVSRILHRAGVPYSGSVAPASAAALNKVSAREVLQRIGVRMPHGVSFSVSNPLSTAEMAMAVFERFGPPYIIKPPQEGSSHGIRYVPTVVELPEALGDVLDEHGAALVEEYIRGHDARVGLIENFRREKLYALPPVHIIRSTDGDYSVRVPSDFSHDIKKELADIARAAHYALGLEHYSCADFRIAPHGIYLLELDSIPMLHEGTAFYSMLESVGSSVKDFTEHMIRLARQAR